MEPEKNGKVDREEFVPKLIKDLKKTGFPLEVKVSSVLENYDWGVQNQVFYSDKNEYGRQVSRTIDIIASKSRRVNKLYDKINIRLIIECKKSSKPWAFFIRNEEVNRLVDLNVVKYRDLPKYSKDYNKYLDRLMLNSHHFRECRSFTIPISTNYHIAFTDSENGERSIFKGINQVIKALDFRFSKTASHTKIFGDKHQEHVLEISYPAIVFEGKLFTVLVKEGNIKPISTKYIQYLERRDSNYLIDVIHISAFEDYLRALHSELLGILKIYKAPQPFLEKSREEHSLWGDITFEK